MATLTTPAVLAERDRWGRPLIIPPDGGKKTAYTRATTLAGTLDDLYGLMGWKQRMTAIGLAGRPDLLLAVQAIADPDKQKRKLDGICEQATEAASASAGATIGTAWHSLTELVDDNQPLPAGLDQDSLLSLEAYRREVSGITFTHAEQFLVCDELAVAGTTDRIGLVDGRPTIFDLKTGKTLKYSGVKIAIQLAVYAHGQIYDPSTGSRTPIDGMDLDRGVVIHMPSDQPGTVTMHWVDLQAGWRYAQLAQQVREVRKARGLIANGGPSVGPVPLLQAIADCRTPEQLTALWQVRQGEWNEDATNAARGHLQFLADQNAA